MKLVELVNYFRTGGSYEKFCQDKLLDVESEIVEIYMEKPFDLGNDLGCFEIEKTKGKIEYISKISYGQFKSIQILTIKNRCRN